MNWKKEAKNWAIMLIGFGILYVTGLIPPLMGGLQSIILSTGLIKPKITLENKTSETFDFTGQFLDEQGDRVGLSQYRGKTLFINLWATWCPPCRAEMPHIAELYKKTASEDVVFLMIALDDDFEKSKKFVKDKNFPFPIVHAAYGLNPSLQSQAIPTTLVVSPEGKIVFYQEGMSNFDTKEFREFLTSGMY